MEILKIAGIGLIGTFLSITVKNYRPELGLCTALCTATILIYLTLSPLKSVVSGIYALSESSLIDSGYIKTILKIIGIAYITQFAAELSKDAGEGMLAKKIEIAGKISVLAVMMPIITELLNAILETLSDF